MSYDVKTVSATLSASKEWLARELGAIRTGRAAPSILDAVRVEVYGTQTEVGHMASISIEDAKTLRIAPYDASHIKALETAITAADLGVSLASDQSGLRVVFPALTAERRQMFVKLAKERLEQARISVRQERQRALDELNADKKAGSVGEDDAERTKDAIQKAVEAVNADLEVLFAKKEKEILE